MEREERVEREKPIGYALVWFEGWELSAVGCGRDGFAGHAVTVSAGGWRRRRGSSWQLLLLLPLSL